jgi:hypothetical protein
MRIFRGHGFEFDGVASPGTVGPVKATIVLAGLQNAEQFGAEFRTLFGAQKAR